ncbi:MAG: primosomal protein DnaI [Lactobacillus sp.]|nr:primosomal protein DnaI [Lactobacillus sp.]
MRSIGEYLKIPRKIDKDAIWQEMQTRPEITSFLAEHGEELDPAKEKISFSALYTFYTHLLRPDKVTSGYQEELVVDSGAVRLSYTPTKETIDRNKKRAADAKLILVGPPESVRNIQLLDADKTPPRAEAFNEILAFLDKLEKGQEARGLYLAGDFGVGKTYLLSGLANACTAIGKTVAFVHFPSFLSELSNHFKDNTVSEKVDELKTADVLLIDDIGSESLSPWSRDDILGSILQYRMDRKMSTFFSSNLRFPELETFLANTKNEVNEAKAKRLMERIKFLSKEIVVGGKNYREF